jgi:7-carboxy-7-deazaguanine synthase
VEKFLIRISEIFNSIDGEVTGFGQGGLTTFIRFAGCNLRCSYCDTPDSLDKHGGTETSFQDILEKVVSIGCPRITITGGEPLNQSFFLSDLMVLLLREIPGCQITIETNGTRIPLFDFCGHSQISWIMDYKLPSSKIKEKPSLSYFELLSSNDWVKFVIGTKEDFNEALQVKKELQLNRKCQARFAFGVLYGKLEPQILLKWLQSNHIWDSSINLQLHKIAGMK